MEAFSLLFLFDLQFNFLPRISHGKFNSSLSTSSVPCILSRRICVGLYLLEYHLYSVGLIPKLPLDAHSPTFFRASCILSVTVSTNLPDIVRIITRFHRRGESTPHCGVALLIPLAMCEPLSVGQIVLPFSSFDIQSIIASNIVSVPVIANNRCPRKFSDQIYFTHRMPKE